MDERLIRRALAVNYRNLALGHDVAETSLATFVRDRRFPTIYDANFIFDVKGSRPDELTALLAEARVVYKTVPQVTIRVDRFTHAAVEARLVAERFRRTDAVLLVLTGALNGSAGERDIRKVEGDAGWSEYERLKCIDWVDYAPRIGEDAADMRVPEAMAACSRLKCPPVTCLIAYDEGAPVGFCSTWAGLDGIGQVEDLFVRADYRRRGIATSLLFRGVEDARQHGASSVVIVADATDTPLAMYKGLGWKAVTTIRQYSRRQT